MRQQSCSIDWQRSTSYCTSSRGVLTVLRFSGAWVTELRWSCAWTRAVRTTPTIEGRSRADLSFALVFAYRSTLKPITLSSTEAEYVAMATGFRKTIVMRYLLILFFPDRDVGCTTVKEENEGAIHLSKKPCDHSQQQANRYPPSLSSGTCC